MIQGMMGELHISDLIFLVVISPTFFLLYAYLQKDNFLGDGISPTFYYSSPSLIRPSISQHFFTTVISTKMGKSLANSTFFSSPFFSFPINITEVWLAFDCKLPHFPLTPSPPPLTPPPPFLPPSPSPPPSLTRQFFWTYDMCTFFFQRYALFSISEMCQVHIFPDISEM